MPGSFPEHALFIDVTFMTILSISISASIHRIGEDAMDGRVGWGGPANLAVHVRSRRKGKTLRTEPKPDLANGSQFGEFREDRVNHAHHRFVGMKAHFAVLFAPHEAHR